jgi:MFS family permease
VLRVSQGEGFGAVLRKRHFLLLWTAQAFSQTAQNGIHFVQMVLIEKLTHSTSHMAVIILAFTLPGVLFSSLAGVAVDRLSHKVVLVGSNALRVLTVSGYIFFLYTLKGGYLLLALYLLTFISSAIGQFFSPAEAATIPLLVGEKGLLSANALFNLTLISSQVVGLIILAPLAVKLLGIDHSFVLIAVMYLAATVLVSLLPRDAPKLKRNYRLSPLVEAWEEIQEGWRFVVSRRPIFLAISQLALVATLLLTLAMLAPGFAARVLHLTPEDAIYVFAPAGLGLFLATILVGRYGHHFRRESLSNTGLLTLGLTLMGLTFVAGRMGSFSLISPLTVISILAFLMGAEIAMITVPAQTVMQERSPAEIRGRVIAFYFMTSNLVAIPPMLFIGVVADQIGRLLGDPSKGILSVMVFLALMVIFVAGASVWRTHRLSPRGKKIREVAGERRERVGGVPKAPGSEPPI